MHSVTRPDVTLAHRAGAAHCMRITDSLCFDRRHSSWPWSAVGRRVTANNNTITRRRDDELLDSGHAGLPRLIAAFECKRPRCPGLRLCLTQVDEVLLGRGVDRAWSRTGQQLRLTLPDEEVSRQHVSLARQGDSWILHDLGSKNGTHLNGAPATRRSLADGDIIEIGTSLLVYRDRPEAVPDAGDRDLSVEQAVPEVFRTLSLQLERRVFELALIAPTSVPVVVVGETGTGKELVAQAIHVLSGRPGPFVPVNCGALPAALIESELFGHRRGAFSGARGDHVGLARKADGGTLFLDEVAELPEESQVALLRLLQEGEVRPVGSSEFIRVNVRVVAATHQELPTRIADGRFRRDLYGRLAGYEMRMPPLRERPEDIGSLIAALLGRFGTAGDELSVHPDAARALFTHSYPMNVRELEQALAAALALASGRQIGLRHLPQAIRRAAPSAPVRLPPEDALLRVELVELLRQSKGNVTATARALNRAPVQVRRWCRRLGIDVADFRHR
jgi:transcriptional regulator with AAA-type ATPase domain